MAAASDPDEVLHSTTGKSNFQRVTRLLISGGTTLLREVFDQICPPSHLPIILRNPVKVRQLKAAKLTKPQWDCLYPSPGVYGKSTDFDITLLFKLLRTICSLSPPLTGWDALPASTDHSLPADLSRIKFYRNSVYGHVNRNMEIADDFEFLSLWQEISGALVRIAGHISLGKKHQWQKAIDNILKDPLTAEDERNVEELKKWYRNDMEVKETMEKLEVTTHEGFKCLEAQQKNTTEEVQQGFARLEVKVKDMLCQVFNSLAEITQSTQGILTKNGSTETNSQAGTSEGQGMNDRIVYESGAGVTEITFMYEQVKVLQGEIGEQGLRLWDIIKRFVATNNELVTKDNENRSRLLSTLKRSFVWGLFVIAGLVTVFFISVVGLVLSNVGNFALIAENLKDICSAKEREETKRIQLQKVELQRKDGQLTEALHVFETKFVSFKQHLDDIVKFCHEHPDELVVLRGCGQVSSQQVLSDISSFMSRLEDFYSSACNSRENQEETIQIIVEEPMPFNKEVGVIEDDSAFNADEMVMKWKGLITAPIISTTKTMT